jgi:hypothetical protein
MFHDQGFADKEPSSFINCGPFIKGKYTLKMKTEKTQFTISTKHPNKLQNDQKKE